MGDPGQNHPRGLAADEPAEALRLGSCLGPGARPVAQQGFGTSTQPGEGVAEGPGASGHNRVSGEYGPLADVPAEVAQEPTDGQASLREAGLGAPGCSYWQGEPREPESKRTTSQDIGSSSAVSLSRADSGDQQRPPEAGVGDNLLQAPLQKLWELERLEMARHREELRNVRGEPRSTGSGDHSRYR